MLLDFEGVKTDHQEADMPSINHSYLTKKLIYVIESNPSWEAWPELTLQLNGSEATPDISVFKAGVLQPNFQSDTIKCEKTPTIIIEIISPTQGIQKIVDKATELLQAGVPGVWLLEPFTNTLMAYDQQGLKRFREGKVSIQGITIDLTDIFKPA